LGGGFGGVLFGGGRIRQWVSSAGTNAAEALGEQPMHEKPIQDYYSDETAVCYGCGRNNPDGLHIQTRWDGREGVCRFTPEPQHTAFPGFVYGGLVASLIDCHSMGTAIAAAYEAAGRAPGTEPEITYVTGSLSVRYLKPTPVGVELVLRSRVTEMLEKKATVVTSVSADGVECVSGEVVAVRVASRMMRS
jgi:acyl-coenzyme A thioesterase PaaI-like protein